MQQEQIQPKVDDTQQTQAAVVGAVDAAEMTEEQSVTALAVTNDEKTQLESRAEEFIAEIEQDPTHSSAKVQELLNIGSLSQTRSSRLLEEKADKLIYDPEKRNQAVSENLVDFRVELDKINPAAVEAGVIYKILRLICPWWADKIVLDHLNRIIAKKQSIQQNLNAIKRNLEYGELTLKSDSAELWTLKDQLLAQRKDIDLNVALVEVLLEKVAQRRDAAVSANVKQFWSELHTGLLRRLQDFEAINLMFEQFIITIDRTCRNNGIMAIEVRNLITLGIPTLIAAVMIELSLKNQRRVLDAANQTRAYIGRNLKRNAKLLGKAEEEIANYLKEPIVAMADIKEATDDIIATLDRIQQSEAEIASSAQKNITEIRAKSAELAAKSGNRALGEEPTAADQLDALEASALLKKD